MLLRKGADPNRLHRGWNAVMQAVENGDANILKLFSASTGIDLSAKDDTGRTVMEIAEGRGLDEAVGNVLRGAKGGAAK